MCISYDPARLLDLTLPCIAPSQMKRRLRAEIFDAYIQMGQRGLPVDQELYHVVRSKLANETLCGRHTRTSTVQEMELPPQAPSKQRRRLSESVQYEIEAIVAE